MLCACRVVGEWKQRPPLLLPLPSVIPHRQHAPCGVDLAGLSLRIVSHPRHRLGAARRTTPCIARRRPQELATTGAVVAWIDLGEIHIAAVTTTRRHALVVSGRMLRACNRCATLSACHPARKTEPLSSTGRGAPSASSAAKRRAAPTLSPATLPLAASREEGRGLLRAGERHPYLAV